MNLVESVSLTHTPAPKKQRRKPGYWNNPKIIALCKLAMETGKPIQGEVSGNIVIVTPNYNLIKSAQTPKYLQTHEKCRVAIYGLLFTLGVEKGETIRPEWLKDETPSSAPANHAQPDAK